VRLLLIRHAQTVWNAAGRVQGQADPPLSDLGRAQCAALGQRLAGYQLDGLFSSDLGRARLTAEAVAAATGARLQRDAGLREVGLGEWEGIDRERLAAEYPALFEVWRRARSWDIVPGGEGAEEFRSRVVDTVSRLLAGTPDEATIALVTHIGVIRMVLSIVAGLEAQGLRWPWALDNTAISTLVGPPGVATWNTPALHVLAINDAVHLAPLEAAG